MLSFHNDAAVKQKYVTRLEEHHRLDQIIQGTGYDGARGCMVGCTLEKYVHSAYESELGLPEWYAHLCDKIFEGLPAEKAPAFAMAGLTAIPVGVDITPVKWQLAILRHQRDLARLESNTEIYAEECRKAIHQVIDYCEKELSGFFKTAAARSAAAWSARSAAWSAAWSARSAAWSAESAAWSARSAAESARSAAESAAAWSAAESAAWSARSAAWSAAWSAPETNHYIWEAETLIRLFSEL